VRHGALGLGFALSATHAKAQAAARADRWPNFQQQDHALVREVVGASHRSLERVTELVTAHPALVNATHDWGFGDWETALGAASHVGNREVATFLLARGARLDIFAAAMLGFTDVVKAMLAALPDLARTRGPHGITLLAHARAGEHAPTIAYLEACEGAGGPEVAASEPVAAAPYVGTYTGEVGEIAVSEGRLGLMFQTRDQGSIRLTPTGEHTFHPAGAPNVRIVFTVVDGAATRVEVVEADWVVSAVRRP